MGRCNILKMTILPKFLYLMQALPIHIPASYFKQVQSIFTEFVWAKKRPRLPHNLLVLPKQNGGLALPNIRKYHQAVHLGRLIDWCCHQETKLWTQIEQAQSETPLNRAPWCYTFLPSGTKRHPLIGYTTRVCARLISNASISSPNSPLYLIWETPGLRQVYMMRSFGG